MNSSFVRQITINSFWPSDTIWWHRSGSTLAQVMTCCLTAPSHYLNQCCQIISEVLRHSPDGYFTANTQHIYLWCDLEKNYFLKITSTSARGQWVNNTSKWQHPHDLITSRSASTIFMYNNGSRATKPFAMTAQNISLFGHKTLFVWGSVASSPGNSGCSPNSQNSLPGNQWVIQSTGMKLPWWCITEIMPR